jgi:hypothetical protein
MIDPKTDPIELAREALDALNYGGNWSNFDAPALVRGLLAVIDAQALTITGAQTTIAELLDERSGLLNSLAATEQQRDEARAIIEGSDVPPTDAEVEAHERANGLGSSWLCMWEGRPRVIEHSSGVRYIRGTGGRPWWPLDAKCRPCKRAVVTP